MYKIACEDEKQDMQKFFDDIKSGAIKVNEIDCRIISKLASQIHLRVKCVDHFLLLSLVKQTG